MPGRSSCAAGVPGERRFVEASFRRQSEAEYCVERPSPMSTAWLDAKILPRPTADAQGPGNCSARSPSSCALSVRATLLSEARDIGPEVPGFVAAKLHIGHLWMWIHQELRDLFRAEPGHPGNGSKGRRIVRPSRLIVGDDVAGRAPTPCQPFAVRHIGGQCLSARRPNADAKSKGRQRSENRIGSTPKKVSHAAAPRRRVGVRAKKTRLATVG